MGGLLFNYLRPLPIAAASLTNPAEQAEATNLSWPTQGSAAIGAQGYGVLATHGSQTPRPTASMAKIITVLAVLEKHPLRLGEQGPTLTMTQADYNLYAKYMHEDGSYATVAVGEKISEYQVLQATLLPSANNMADSLAVWTFGSLDNYRAYANDMVKHFGLTSTTVGSDASGFLPDSTSTPSDFIKLGELALQNPVIAQIVAQPTATIPVQGVITSANSRLGINGIIGIKTGLTDQAGGCFLFAAKYTPSGSGPITIIGVIMGTANLNDALKGSGPLLNSAKPYFSVKTPVKAGQVFATLTTAWTNSVQVIAKTNITLLAWRGAPLVPHIELAQINRSLPANTQVGTAIISSGESKATTPLVLRQAIQGPSWQWRVKRI